MKETADQRVYPLGMWGRSLTELKNVRAITFCGLMAALAIVLNYVASIDLGPYIRITFSGIPNQIVAYLFGPAVGCLFGGLLDILKFIIKPTGAFFPGFTISAALGGAVYGMLLYRRPVRLWRVFLSQLIIKVFINVGLNTLWLKMLYGKGFFALLPGRIASNAVMLFVDTGFMYIILKMIEQSVRRFFDTDTGNDALQAALSRRKAEQEAKALSEEVPADTGEGASEGTVDPGEAPGDGKSEQ